MAGAPPRAERFTGSHNGAGDPAIVTPALGLASRLLTVSSRLRSSSGKPGLAILGQRNQSAVTAKPSPAG